MTAAGASALIGAVLGFLFKWLFDVLTERMRQAREDMVWRRERLIDAGAEFPRATSDLALAYHLKVQLENEGHTLDASCYASTR